jgi:hypothetical protein
MVYLLCQRSTRREKLVRRETFMGHAEIASVRLSERERATLRSAAAILTRLREMRGTDLDDDTTGVDIALAAYVCEEIAQEGSVESSRAA